MCVPGTLKAHCFKRIFGKHPFPIPTDLVHHPTETDHQKKAWLWGTGLMYDDVPPGKLTCPLKITGWKMYFLLK